VSTVMIGVGYKARHGKDTVCKAIIEAKKDVYDIRRYAFGDVLKMEVNAAAKDAGGMFALFNQLSTIGIQFKGLERIKIPDWVKYEPDADTTDPVSPLGKQRTLLQWWGTEYRRAQDPFYWVKQMKQVLEIEQPQIALISDVRFQNEFLWIKSNGGFTVRVDREGFQSLSTNSSHASENQLALAPFDFEIHVKDGELDVLKQDALTVFEMIEAVVNPQYEANHVVQAVA
jgi:hypothetical protein